MWNQRTLHPPPTNSFKVKVTPGLRVKLTKAQKQLKDGNVALPNHLLVLKSEHYVQDRLIYKLSSQFRSEKSMKSLKQARVCLNRLKELDIQRQLTELEEAYDFQELEPDTYLPSKQVLQYHLVKLISTAALLSRTCQLTYNTYFHAKQMLSIGIMLPQVTAMIALASRLWVTCKSLQSYVCDWYQVLFPLLEHLQATPIPWLKVEEANEEDELPVCLYDWLQSQFGVDTATEEDSVILDSGQLDPTISIGENDVDAGNKSVYDVATEDVGELIQRKRPESVMQNIQIEVGKDFAKFTSAFDTMEHSGRKMDMSSVEYDDSLNDLCRDETSTNNNQTISGDISNEKKLRKCLRKQLKSEADIMKCLRHIQENELLTVGKFDLVITKALKKKSKEMFETCTNYLKRKQDETSDLEGKVKKILINKLLKLEQQYKVALPQQVTCSSNLDTNADTMVETSKVENLVIKNKPGNKSKQNNKKVGTKKKKKKMKVKTFDGEVIVDSGQKTATERNKESNISSSGEKKVMKGKLKGKQKRTKVKKTVADLETNSSYDKRARIDHIDGTLKSSKLCSGTENMIKERSLESKSRTKMKRKQGESSSEPKKKKKKLSQGAMIQKQTKSEKVHLGSETLMAGGPTDKTSKINKLKTKNLKKKKKAWKTKLR